MRAFLAITLPEDVRRSLTVLQEDLAGSRADVKWVEPPNLHVTLKFFGEIAEQERQAIEALLARVAQREPRFTLAVEGVGAFPTLTAPRVVWVGLGEGKDAAARIAQTIDREGDASPLQREERPFAAHITLGRVRSGRNRPALVQRLRAVSWQPPGPWQVTSLTLYQSILGSEGPRYSALADIPLKTL